MVYSPQANGAGLAGPIADAIAAAITKAVPNYIPLARQANAQAINIKTGRRSLPNTSPVEQLKNDREVKSDTTGLTR